MSTRDRLAGKTKQGATSSVNFGWHISIIKAMFINTIDDNFDLRGKQIQDQRRKA
jgi:hypothetical protein